MEGFSLTSADGTSTITSHAKNLLFQSVDTVNADFSIRSTSPARDNGINSSPLITTDILGVSRPQGPAYDIGAYEFGPGGLPIASVSPSSLSFSGQNVNTTSVGLPITVQNTGTLVSLLSRSPAPIRTTTFNLITVPSDRTLASAHLARSL
jgi:hypothetical protein